jgi:hypothetical protein
LPECHTYTPPIDPASRWSDDFAPMDLGVTVWTRAPGRSFVYLCLTPQAVRGLAGVRI